MKKSNVNGDGDASIQNLNSKNRFNFESIENTSKTNKGKEIQL
jgi:hypothetical protein